MRPTTVEFESVLDELFPQAEQLGFVAVEGASVVIRAMNCHVHNN